jgi:hypothetical protein
MDNKIAGYLRDWNLSEWLSTAFLELIKPGPEVDVFSLIPEPLEIQTDLIGPFQLYVNSEFLIFNRFVRMVKEEKNTFVRVVPAKWKSMIGCGCASDIMEFIEFLKAKREALLKLATSRFVNVAYITNLQGLFHAYLQDAVMSAESTVDLFELVFKFGQEVPNSLILKGLYVVGCLFDGKKGLVKPTGADSFIHKMPVVSCMACGKSAFFKDDRFMCPLFRCLHHQTMMVDFERVDGESKNFVCYIPVTTGIGDKYLIANGVCFVCQAPESMKTCIIE